MRAALPLLALLLVALAPTAPAEEDTLRVDGSGVYACTPIVGSGGPSPCPDVFDFRVAYEGPNGGSAPDLLRTQEAHEGSALLTEEAPGLFQLVLEGASAGWRCEGRGSDLSALPLRCTGLPPPSARARTTPGAGSADVCRRTCAT